MLERDARGVWSGERTAAGTEPPALRASPSDSWVGPAAIPGHVLDVDVQWSPVTNLMPMRRLGLDHIGASATFTMAWVSVPSLAITLDVQRYTMLGTDDGDVCARFDAGDGFFSAVIRSDPDGVVRDYPGIARRLG